MKSQRSIFLTFLLVFSVVFILVEFINGKLWTNDFRVYYEATRDFFAGNNPYLKNYGLDTGYFKYAPFTLYLFRLPSIFPYGIAQLLHLFVLLFCLSISIPLLKKMSELYFPNLVKKQRSWILYFAFGLGVTHIVREFHMGNVNLILLALAVSGLFFWQKQKEIPAVLVWGGMLVLKPITILALVPLLFFRKWRIIIYLSILGGIFFVFPMIHLGMKQGLELWSSWFDAISAHGDYIVSENSLKYYSATFFGIQSNWGLSLLVMIVLCGFFIWDCLKNKASNHQFYFWTVLLLAFTPNFFVTDTEHFLLSLPLIIYLLFQLLNRNHWITWIVFGIGVFGFSLNINDIWGHSISDVMDEIGVLGLGNLTFIFLALVIHFKQEKIES